MPDRPFLGEYFCASFFASVVVCSLHKSLVLPFFGVCEFLVGVVGGKEIIVPH